ncbi:helix-turn-helix transcriptional regulator [Candidatus Poribacteria bacterium]|jgi:PadR family transcriptional regulator, regulatory protein PadR|nr:helix-turn-helix transcriptional regulator [Candidatus Poribacteria bacterium]MBT5534960.1 helix-turn-helix transcriptional regulator [Candidatus Poribacteria bacterium]MBT5711586.1 helix-turn-helix transcriptional regulator [Candidatus Poribacteria bacterium]MBT7097334.1 helix-turn-helix transcriptional regulator [Candidatus Poribacteria bacterium]MBT7809482.1 helix-turn-helix transcriptional regulator [Candidatus Poribacteria bacterium]
MVTKDLVAASSRPLILGILAQGESYGYEIIKRVRELSDGELAWTDGMLYPVLRRLEADGLIVSEWRVSDAGRRRRYYQINGDGAEALATERRQWGAVHGTLEKVWGPA